MSKPDPNVTQEIKVPMSFDRAKTLAYEMLVRRGIWQPEAHEIDQEAKRIQRDHNEGEGR